MPVSPTRLIAPMLATLGDLPGGPGWGFEFKWDGVRAITYLHAGVRVVSRNHRDVTATYPELSELGALLAGREAVVDGEIVALDPAGRPSFAQLQRRMHVVAPTVSLLAAVPVAYYVFDLLRLDGQSTLEVPYQRRRELLDTLPLDGESILRPAHMVDLAGAQVMAAARQRRLEGVVAKRLTSVYRPGRRSPDWIKTPINHTQEVVIIGYKPGQGRRAATIGSLVLAVHDPAGQLVFAGGVGTGFTQDALTQLQHRLGPWRRPTSPISGIPREHARGVQWVDPQYVGEVAYRSWTPEGHLRHPSWRGLRPDCSPAEARRPDVIAPAGAESEVVDGTMTTADGRWRVDAVHRGADSWYRLRHDDNIVDGLTITEVEKVLGKVGVDLSDLHETADPFIPSRDATA